MISADLDGRAVLDFFSAEKVVSGPRGATSIRWNKLNGNHADWRAPLELADGRIVGEVYCFVNLALPRHWRFKTNAHGVEVLVLDVTMMPVKHTNGPARPPFFPRVCRATEHEHVWVPGGAKATFARPLHGLRECTHEAVWDAFCKRARIRSTLTYIPPFYGHSLTLPGL